MYEYPGSRDEHSLMAFGKKMSGPSVTILNSYNDAMKYAAESTDDGVAFLGYDAQATGSDKDVLASTTLAQVYAQAARKEKAFGHFLWLKPGAEGIGERATRFVSRIETGVDPQFWMDAAPASDETDSAITTESLLTFIRKENVPTLSTLGPTNFQKIGNSGRPLVISVLDMENKELVTAVKDHMVNFIASPLAKEYKEKYYFSLMDGKKWAKFLQQFNVLEVDNPQVFLLDVPSKHFWQNASYNTVGEFLNGVKNGTIPRGTSTGKSPPKGNLAKLEAFFWDAFPYSLIAISLVVIGIIFICIPSGDDMVPPYDREPLEYDDDDEGEDAKQEPTQGKETPAEETESKKVK